MMTSEGIKEILDGIFQGGHIEVEDMTGTMDHFQIAVAWEGFRGKGLIEQHQMVNRALAAPLEDGRIHALKIKTSVPKN